MPDLDTCAYTEPLLYLLFQIERKVSRKDGEHTHSQKYESVCKCVCACARAHVCVCSASVVCVCVCACVRVRVRECMCAVNQKLSTFMTLFAGSADHPRCIDPPFFPFFPFFPFLLFLGTATRITNEQQARN